jgi:hypothetical protein
VQRTESNSFSRSVVVVALSDFDYLREDEKGAHPHYATQTISDKCYQFCVASHLYAENSVGSKFILDL